MSYPSFFRSLPSAVHGKRQGRVPFFGSLQKAGQIRQGCILVVMAAAAGIRQLIDTARLQAIRGRHELEGMAQRGTGLGAHGNSGHMTADTVGKRVDGMGIFVGVSGMTAQALTGAGPYGLELSRG